eukprot:COSAG06_NODE_5456_length_3469_cov_26.223442_2_plen_100_part_00
MDGVLYDTMHNYGHTRTCQCRSMPSKPLSEGPRRIGSQQRADRDLLEARGMLQYCGSFEAELESQIDAVERGWQQMEQQMDPSARLAALLLAGNYVATS